MAVSTDKIKERFKVLFPTLNLSSKRLDELAARLAQKPADDADDAAVDQVINDANTYVPFSDLARTDDVVRDLQGKLDQKGKKTPQELADEAAAKKKSDDAAAAAEEAKGKAPDWFKAYAESQDEKFNKISGTIEAIKTGNTISKNTDVAKQLFGSSKILGAIKDDAQKSFWLSQIKVTDETTQEQIEEQITTLEGQYGVIVQSKADETVHAGAPPASTKPDATMTNKEAVDLAKDIL